MRNSAKITRKSVSTVQRVKVALAGISKIEARLSYVTSNDKALLYLAEVLKVPVQELFPPRTQGNPLHDFMEKLETTRF